MNTYTYQSLIREISETFHQSIDDTFNCADEPMNRIGAELKFPVVDGNGLPPSQEKIDALWRYLADKGWQAKIDPVTDEIVGAKYPGELNHTQAGCETGYCKVEFSLAHVGDLHVLSQQVEALRATLKPFSEQHNIHFLGYGIQPCAAPSSDLFLTQARSSVWEEVCPSNQILPKNEGDDVNMFTVNAGSHVHCSVPADEAVNVVNLFNGYAPAFIALTANSSVWKNRISNYLCIAEKFWDWWSPASDRSGLAPREFNNLPDYLESVLDYRPIFIMRDGNPILLKDYDRFIDFYSSEFAQGETLDNEMVNIAPTEADLGLHNSCYWYCGRISKYYTVELRCCDQQRPDELLSVSSLVLGLVSNGDAAREALSSITWEELAEARHQACLNGLEGVYARGTLADFAKMLVDIAEEGLRKRGLGEEIYLEAAKKRCEKGVSPGAEIRNIFENQGINGVLETCAL